MAEKVVDQFQELHLKSNDLVDQEYPEVFIEALCHKIEQLKQILAIRKEIKPGSFCFSCDIPKISDSDLDFPLKLIELIDELNIHYFFKRKPKNLYSLNWCSKYLMFSSFDNQKKENTVQFFWFKNKFGEICCPCFMCKFNIELVNEQNDNEQN